MLIKLSLTDLPEFSRNQFKPKFSQDKTSILQHSLASSRANMLNLFFQNPSNYFIQGKGQICSKPAAQWSCLFTFWLHTKFEVSRYIKNNLVALPKGKSLDVWDHLSSLKIIFLTTTMPPRQTSPHFSLRMYHFKISSAASWATVHKTKVSHNHFHWSAWVHCFTNPHHHL